MIEPWVAEAVAYGVRSTAPLATALLRLDLPPIGMNAAWAKVTTPATVTNQTAENTAVTASADLVVASATDALGTIAASLEFSAQSQERSGAGSTASPAKSSAAPTVLGSSSRSGPAPARAGS